MLNRIKIGKELICYLASVLLFPTLASASFDLDSKFELESIGVLRSLDNMDGLFNEYVTAAYKDYFSHQTRFNLNDLSSVDGSLERSKLPYGKLIMDRDILSQLAKSSHSQSILRTKIVKSGTEYHFTLDWLHAPQMELIDTLDFSIDDPSTGKALVVDSLNSSLKLNLNKLFGKVPFQGNITGRDKTSVTINLGTSSGLKKGDILTIGSIDDVKQHPLLKKIVEWKISTTGKIEIEQSEEAISFCKILEEEPGREISRAQKILQVQKLSFPQQMESSLEPAEKLTNSESSGGAKIGNFSLSLFPSSYDRQYSDTSGNSNTGGGLALGVGANGEILLTREWFAGLDFKFSFLNFSQNSIATGIQSPASLSGGVSETIFSYKLNVGYLFLLNGDIYGPKGWLKFGLKSDSYNIPSTSGEYTGPNTFSSYFLGAGADLPLRGNWGAITNLSFRLITMVTQSFINDKANGASDVEFYLGGYYHLNQNSTVKLGIQVVSNGATFAAGSSLNQKMVSFVPSLLYYF